MPFDVLAELIETIEGCIQRGEEVDSLGHAELLNLLRETRERVDIEDYYLRSSQGGRPSWDSQPAPPY